MPEKITAYRCKYRCGHRVYTKKEPIRLHENICFSNPNRRACKSCKLWEDSVCEDDHLPEDKYAIFNGEYHKLIWLQKRLSGERTISNKNRIRGNA